MNRRLWQTISCFIAAASVTFGLYAVDHARQEHTQLDQALRWARQITAQGEGLILEARERGTELDPVGWAARVLTQGNDSRIVTVSKFTSESASSTPEKYSLDLGKGVFDYSKFVDFQDNSGLKIRLLVGQTGFLGAKSQLAHDLSVAGVFVLLFLVSIAYSAPLFGFRHDTGLRDRILAWISDFKGVLTSLGVHIRDLLREAGTLAAATKKSQEAVSVLRERVHTELSIVRSERRKGAVNVKTAQRAEVLARFIAKELANEGPGSPLPAMSAELHRLVLELVHAQKDNDTLLKAVETRLEPVATDADVAFHAFDEVYRASEGMSFEIRKTTETMLDQARLMRDLKEASTK